MQEWSVLRLGCRVFLLVLICNQQMRGLARKYKHKNSLPIIGRAIAIVLDFGLA